MHAGMLFLNLLPVLPLDGGRMIFSCGVLRVFPIAALPARRACASRGRHWLCERETVGCVLAFTARFWQEKLNLSLLLVGGYLIVYAHQNRSALQLENLHALLQERQPG
ncbi:MAG: hypothetical protein ACLUHE_17370 [Christensenellales bacterium]